MSTFQIPLLPFHQISILGLWCFSRFPILVFPQKLDVKKSAQWFCVHVAGNVSLLQFIHSVSLWSDLNCRLSFSYQQPQNILLLIPLPFLHQEALQHIFKLYTFSVWIRRDWCLLLQAYFSCFLNVFIIVKTRKPFSLLNTFSHINAHHSLWILVYNDYQRAAVTTSRQVNSSQLSK